jgi:peptide/nickel transport system ATP-binding protein
MKMENSRHKDCLLSIQDVCVSYKTKRGSLMAVREASVEIGVGESVALIGESGCGKTTLAASVAGALPAAAAITGGRLIYHSQSRGESDLFKLGKKALRPILWEEISMVFQASQSSFNPVKKIRTQFIDTVRAHQKGAGTAQILERSRELLETVMLDGSKVLNAYPHELSGGMKQRALIALALLLNPRLIILDEPTTALDLLTQEKILVLLKELKKRFGFSLLFITHDLGIVRELADVVVTMYAGRVVERAPAAAFFETPRHPYSRGLLGAIPRLSMDSAELCSIPGSPPDMIDLGRGCPFAPRCSRRVAACGDETPPMKEMEGGARACACLNPETGGTPLG